MLKQIRTERDYFRSILSYFIILTLIFVHYAFNISVLQYVISLALLLIPFFLRRRIHFILNINNIIRATALSSVILVPFYFLFMVLGGRPSMPAISLILSHLIIASIPEEVYFRGYLQETYGNNYRGIFLVSILFALSHSPRFFLDGDSSAFFTFFPSLVMGWLYMKKKNLLYPIIFHYLSNILFISFF